MSDYDTRGSRFIDLAEIGGMKLVLFSSKSMTFNNLICPVNLN